MIGRYSNRFLYDGAFSGPFSAVVAPGCSKLIHLQVQAAGREPARCYATVRHDLGIYPREMNWQRVELIRAEKLFAMGMSYHVGNRPWRLVARGWSAPCRTQTGRHLRSITGERTRLEVHSAKEVTRRRDRRQIGLSTPDLQGRENAERAGEDGAELPGRVSTAFADSAQLAGSSI